MSNIKIYEFYNILQSLYFRITSRKLQSLRTQRVPFLPQTALISRTFLDLFLKPIV